MKTKISLSLFAAALLICLGTFKDIGGTNQFPQGNSGPAATGETPKPDTPK
jgi:hypothetical protein